MAHLIYTNNGEEIEYKDIIPEDPADRRFMEMIADVAPYTLTARRGIEALYGLYKAVQYIVEKKIPGGFVECGVWRGGAIILCALTLKHFGDLDRRIYLYDTFEGMTAPEARDIDWDGVSEKEKWDTAQEIARGHPGATLRSGFGGNIETVRKNVLTSGYPEKNFIFIKGPVEQTIPATVPGGISLLRLDTDWYSSTYHELVHLYPLLNAGGVLIIDDYGWCRGAREATDQYFKEKNPRMFLTRTDSSVRMGVKLD